MSITIRSSLAAVLAAGVVSSSFAQPAAAPRPPSSSDDPTTLATGRVVDATLEAQLRIAERPETAARIAAYKRNLYEALLKKGFSGDQAIQLTIATPLPTTTR